MVRMVNPLGTTVSVEEFSCEICGMNVGWRWTDTHGIGACLECGAPYRLLHYDENGQYVARPPTLLIKPAYLELTKLYWETEHRNVAPGAFNIDGSSYEVATQEDFVAISVFWKAHQTKE